jgi:hypothetical protein
MRIVYGGAFDCIGISVLSLIKQTFHIMATKKSAAKKKSAPTFFEKLGERASQVKDKLVEEKNHLVEVAGDTIDAVKEKIHDFRTKKAAPPKRTRAKKPTAKPAKKTPVKAAKKASKKAIAKVAKKPVARSGRRK